MDRGWGLQHVELICPQMSPLHSGGGTEGTPRCLFGADSLPDHWSKAAGISPMLSWMLTSIHALTNDGFSLLASIWVFFSLWRLVLTLCCRIPRENNSLRRGTSSCWLSDFNFQWNFWERTQPITILRICLLSICKEALYAPALRVEAWEEAVFAAVQHLFQMFNFVVVIENRVPVHNSGSPLFGLELQCGISANSQAHTKHLVLMYRLDLN